MAIIFLELLAFFLGLAFLFQLFGSTECLPFVGENLGLLRPHESSSLGDFFQRCCTRSILMQQKTNMDSSDGSILTDVVAAALSSAVCRSALTIWGQMGKKGLFGVLLVRKLAHISGGLTVMLFWPMFSLQARLIAGIIPTVCYGRGLLVALGILEDQALLKHLRSRFRDRSDMLKAILGYDLAIAFATVFYWRTPLAVATICNLCAGDGFADIVGRKFGSRKLPYNKNKSFAGSIAMAIAGFLASILFMYYFAWIGYVKESPNTALLGFLILSIASAVVESHPLSTKLDDNLTVPLICMLLGSFVL